MKANEEYAKEMERATEREEEKNGASTHTHIPMNTQTAGMFCGCRCFFFSLAVKRCKGETDECDYTQRKQR